MEPGGTVFTWERWPGENGEQKGVPCAEVVIYVGVNRVVNMGAVYADAVFNTDSNHSVVQTYNFTTFKSCDYDDSVGNETVEWSSTNHPTPSHRQSRISKITVSHGKGLPDSLKDPSDQAPAPNAADYGSTPDTVVPFDFNNPHDQDTDVKKDSGSISLHVKNLDMKLNGILLSLGILYMF
ncbi:hypothetical protein D5086_002456 [Populus alba]|uniref:Uncharacterized protein n=1 Tax=Populus alba TaxID=43335 RepID=A0ACC4D3V3_POPAL